MMTINQQSVNVKRSDLIVALHRNMLNHEIELVEAKKDYSEAAVLFLTDALNRAKEGDLSNISFDLDPPVSHVAEFMDVIEMLEMSVDENINLDKTSFKAYIKNEWPWRRSFNESAVLYKSAVFGAKKG